MAAPLCLVFGIEAEVDQRVVPFARFHDDIAAASAIPAGGAAAGNKFLPPERNATVASIPSLDANSSLIDEHMIHSSASADAQPLATWMEIRSESPPRHDFVNIS